MTYAYPHRWIRIPQDVEDMIITLYFSGISNPKIVKVIKKKFPQYNVWYRTVHRYTSRLLIEQF